MTTTTATTVHAPAGRVTHALRSASGITATTVCGARLVGYSEGGPGDRPSCKRCQ